MNNIKDKEKILVDKFTEINGIYASFCELCGIWTVHCPECTSNWCGGGCTCGFATLLDHKQAQLDRILEAAEN